MAMTMSLHHPEVANSRYAVSLSVRAFTNMAPSMSAACGGLHLHNQHAAESDDVHVPQKNVLPDRRSCFPEDAANDALGRRRPLLHPAASRTRRTVSSQYVELGVASFTVRLCHLQWQTEPLQDQCSEQMRRNGELWAGGTHRQSNSRISA